MYTRIQHGAAPIVGSMVRFTASPALANLAAAAGMDFIMVDMEGGPFGMNEAAILFLALRAQNLGAFVRVPELSKSFVSRVLDCGADGVMVPMIETAEQARQFVDWAKYPPLGNRGLSALGGNTGFKKILDIPAYMEGQNARVLAIAQIESKAAIENVDAIAAVSGVDVLLVGPNDLSVSLGCPGQLSDPAMNAALIVVARAAAINGKVFGLHGGTAMLKKWRPEGLGFCMSSTDIDMMAAGMQAIVSDMKID